jgi:hypothetical protein
MNRQRKLNHSPFLAVLGLLLACLGASSTAAQQSGGTTPQDVPGFARLAERLGAQRMAGADENPAMQEKVLANLDAIVLTGLNAPGEPALAALNQRLAALVTREPGTGENFRVMKLSGRAAAYVLTANFSLAGPSAVRVYAGVQGHLVLAAQIDRSTQNDFFDEYLEVVPIAGPADAGINLFVTVAGRTDGLQTGAFTAWSFDGSRLKQLWASDLLQESSYEAAPEGFKLTYCAQTDEENPRLCRRMTRDRYTWDGTEWKRMEQTAVPVPKR